VFVELLVDVLADVLADALAADALAADALELVFWVDLSLFGVNKLFITVPANTVVNKLRNEAPPPSSSR
jgi:hypothetical protein